jgi:hypothetical protein
MRNIKNFSLFEDFDNKEEYIVSSIRGILIELEDEGMEVEIEYHSIQGVTIEIKGNPVDDYPYVMHKQFEVSSIRDYIDTVIDFIEYTWSSYILYFEKYDVDDSCIYDGEVLQDGPVGSLVIQIYKKKI